MSPAGNESEVTTSLWREAGEWWTSETYREVRQFIDSSGLRRETERLMPSIGVKGREVKPYQEDNTEEHSVRIRKVRDEKVSKAMGLVFESYRGTRHIDRNLGEKGSLTSEDLRLNAHRHTEGRKGMRDAWGMRTGGVSNGHVVLPAPSDSIYCPLHILSGYSFGKSSMLAEEIAILCAQHGIASAAIVDSHSLVGCVEFSRMAKKLGVKPLIGASVELPEGGQLVLIARSKVGYVSLSRLLTSCHLDQPRQYPLATWHNLERHSRDLLCITGGSTGPLDRFLIRRDDRGANELLTRLVGLYGRANVFVEIERSYLPWEISISSRLYELAKVHDVTPVAGGMITHSRRSDFPVQDALVCAETLCTVDEIVGRKMPRAEEQPVAPRYPERSLNAERFLRTPTEMSKLFADRPDLLANTLRVAECCDDDVLPSRTKLPNMCENETAALKEIVYAGMILRHRNPCKSLRRRIEYELERICRLNFASHFLAVWDMCRWARERHILFSGRGSVVDSAVAYCLGLSRIDAYEHNLHFDRFLPEDGSKRPDIDIDFEANRRDDVREYLARRYGSDRVATVAAVGAYCTRGIIREVGKVLGLSQEAIGYLAKRIHGGVSPDQLESALDKRPELRNSNIPRERFRWIFELSERMMDIPRNIRAHSSGVVISSEPLADTVPVMWSASAANNGGLWHDKNCSNDYLRIIQWDKRSAKHYFDKIDILCLRGQDVLSGTQEKIRLSSKSLAVDEVSASNGCQLIESFPLDDPETFRAMRAGELIGIPQSASPAMRQVHIRLRTENLHDASLVQAGIRPGVGGAVKLNELIARRRGEIKYDFTHPDLEKILGLTYGVIVFQEQVDQLLQTFAGCTSGEAEDVREAIHQRGRDGYAESIRAQVIERITKRGYSPTLAEEVFGYIAGFQGYGFAQGHALAFAEISIRSIYCQQNFPAQYFASLLSAQPAGYYGPCTIANEARLRGVKVLRPDVNSSGEKFGIEDVKSKEDPILIIPDGGVRVGLMQIAGLSAQTVMNIFERRPYSTFADFVARVEPDRRELEILILCGALDSLCANRRAMLWAIPATMNYAAALKPDGKSARLPLDLPEPILDTTIKDFTNVEKAIYERRILDMDIEHHLMVYERAHVCKRGGITAGSAKILPDRQQSFVVGNPIRLRFPPTKSGKRVVFFDLEDETGLLNVTCFDDVYQKDGHAIICSPYVTVVGEAQLRDGHTAFLANRIFRYDPVLASELSLTESMPIVTADFLAK